MTESRRLLILVGLTSFFFLNVEFLLGRFYSGFWGASIVSWCLLISVFVIGFSLGQFFAFRAFATDEKKSVWPAVGLMYLGSAVFVVLILVTRGWLAAWASSVLPPPIFREALCYLVFVLPITMQIGGVSFLLYKRAVQVSSDPVQAISRVLIVGALGSAVGCWAHVVGLFFIEHVTSLDQLGLWAGVLLLASGWCLKRTHQLAVVATVVVGSLLFVNHRSEPGLIYQLETAYAKFRIYEETAGPGVVHRGLSANYLGLWTCMMTLDKQGALLDSDFFPSVIAQYAVGQVASPGRILILGGGEGCQSQQIEKDAQRLGVKVDFDLVDIDSRVPEIANRFFNPMKTHDHYFVSDARRWLDANAAQYDLIFVDAFFSGMVPVHLLSVEFFEQLHRHLRPGGAILMDGIGQWDLVSLRPSAKATLIAKIVNGLRVTQPEMKLQIFSHAKALGDPVTSTSNFMILLTSGEGVKSSLPLTLPRQQQALLDRARMETPATDALERFGFFTDATNNSDLLFRL